MHKHITLGRSLVPSKHGVDSLRQLDAVSLVDAARIDPGPLESSLRGDAAACEYLLPAEGIFGVASV